MERELFTKLERWMNKKNRKPLIIQGARQVGKTWIMKEFGARFYENTVYINFDNNKAMKDVFDLDFDLKRILSAIKIEYGKSFQAENTLIIFDEIQEAPKALASLKYFYENAPQCSIIAAGSLLGVALHQGTSFPVGKVDFLKLCPMSFNVFILAVGEKGLHEALRSQDYELINAYAGKYTDLLKKYYYVGGMPEVVQTYIDSDDLFEVREIQNNLLQYYEEDFSKHAPKEVVPRIMMVWNSIPSQLAKENRKFMYGALREGARAKDFELAIQWLEDAGLILKSYRVSKPDIPLIAYMEMNSFKMFMFDVGLLTAKAGLSARLLLEGSRIFEEFKGTGNMELVLNRRLAEKRIFPAVDIAKSGTRREELLLTKDEREVVTALHKELSGNRSEEFMEQMLDLFKRTQNNKEFVALTKRSLLRK